MPLSQLTHTSSERPGTAAQATYLSYYHSQELRAKLLAHIVSPSIRYNSCKWSQYVLIIIIQPPTTKQSMDDPCSRQTESREIESSNNRDL